MARTSIRFRITALAVIAVALVLALSAVAVVIAQRSQLTAAIDASLQQRATDVATFIESADETPGEFGTDRDGFAQLVGADGAVLASSANLASLGPLQITVTAASGEQFQTITVPQIDDDTFRVLSRTVTTESGPAVLHVATSSDVVGDSTEALTTTLAIVMPILVLLLAGLVWWLAGRTLRPVEAIRAEVASISVTDLDRRVPLPTSRDEIGLLATTMNEMLARIEAAVERQHQFVADASHELRSPLTRMRSEIEADLLEAAGAPVDAGRLMSLHEEVIALQHLVEDLLHLARADSGHAELSNQAVDLDDLVLSEANRIQAEGRLEVDVTSVSAAHLIGDAAQLRRAVRNLADNAARHADQLVSFSLREEDSSAVLTISDDGPGIPDEEAERVFERFGRVDDSRARHSGGTGLGLSITREIVERHGGTVQVDMEYANGARLVVRMPLT